MAAQRRRLEHVKLRLPAQLRLFDTTLGPFEDSDQSQWSDPRITAQEGGSTTSDRSNLAIRVAWATARVAKV